MGTVAEIVERLLALTQASETVLVAIDGLGGAGKSTLAAAIACKLKSMGRHVTVIHFDDFYLPSSLRPREIGADAPIGGNFDWRRVRDEVLVPICEGRTARYARYDWPTDTLAETHEVPCDGIVIVEGVGSSRNELSPFYLLRFSDLGRLRTRGAIEARDRA